MTTPIQHPLWRGTAQEQTLHALVTQLETERDALTHTAAMMARHYILDDCARRGVSLSDLSGYRGVSPGRVLALRILDLPNPVDIDRLRARLEQVRRHDDAHRARTVLY